MRLTKIYTRTGDAGRTRLGDGQQVEKDDLRICAYGTVDELNSCIGVLLAQDIPQDIGESLMRVQHHLFDVGGELCVPERMVIDDDLAHWLETQLDALNEHLPPLKEFILPGGNFAAASCHVARTVCRRAERYLVSLARVQSVNPATMKYINRLSDYLFVCARVLARRDGGEEVTWQSGKSKP